MAVEVVVPGQIPAKKKMGGKCGRCGCVVKCLQGDATYQSGDFREGSWHEVPCPTIGCGKQICVSVKSSADDDLHVR